jgi:serine/threonine protein kinase
MQLDLPTSADLDSGGRLVQSDGYFPFVELARVILQDSALEGVGRWREHRDDAWCYLAPVPHLLRVQGWKLHIAATPLSAPVVLVRAARVLIAERCAFKFANNLAALERLVSTRCDRAAAGKFITVYPDDDEHFRRVAQRLHEATIGLPGPAILSDRAYQPGSLIYYRFGAFSRATVLSNDGSYEAMLVAPDGTRVRDQRNAWFSPPSWVSNPLPEKTDAVKVPTKPTAVLLADRFVVRSAIQHANKGGVFRATDQTTGIDVVIKQARPHVGATLDGTDVRDRLRHEAKLLDELHPLGISPAKVALFETDGTVFLAEDLIKGLPLRQWVSERVGTSIEGVPKLTEVLAIARGLVDVVGRVHRAGWVLRDLTPNNIMVTSDGSLRLIDLECITRPGARVVRAYTLGYAPVEQMQAPYIGPAPQQSVDLYALGATLFFTASGTDPVLQPESSVGARHAHPAPRERIAAIVALMTPGNDALAQLAPVILDLMHYDAGARPDLEDVKKFLDGIVADIPSRLAIQPSGARDVPPAAVEVHRLALANQERMLNDGLDYVLGSLERDNPHALWTQQSEVNAASDPCNVQYGAGGVLAVLVRAAQCTDHQATETIRYIATWLSNRCAAESQALPGLYFGRSGTAWALYEASRLLGDANIERAALGLARRIPLLWPNPDICHGAAGAGMSQLLFWRSTGDEEFLDRARACADGLVAAAERTPTGAWWTIPRNFNSVLAGLSHLGFAHGVAGIGAFLLAAGAATGRDDFRALAIEAGRTLAATAQVKETGAKWISERNGPQVPWEALPMFWCNGSPGIGTFLIRLWQATGDEHTKQLARSAAEATYRSRWAVPTVVCHGLAGNGELLIDMANALGDERYYGWAQEFAACLFARRTMRDGHILVADESGQHITVGYNAGLSGVLDFLLRLRHRRLPRLWMMD